MALVTVTHNSAAAVERLLRSVELHLPGARVVVADSGSSDGSATVARAAAPRATVLELGDNVGFGRASNAGVALVEEPVCVLINPDPELVDGSLAALAAEALRPDAHERLLAPLVLHPDGERQDSVHGEPVSLPALASGRPVVAPAAGGPAEIVDESCGRLYRPGDAEAAARQVSELLDDRDLLARLSEGARRRAERSFDLRDSRLRFRQLVERLERTGG